MCCGGLILAHLENWPTFAATVFLVNLVQMLVEAALFFNPAVWWISRQIRREREACCDALAVGIHGPPTTKPMPGGSLPGWTADTCRPLCAGHGRLAGRYATQPREQRSPQSGVRRLDRCRLSGPSCARLVVGTDRWASAVSMLMLAALLWTGTPGQR